MLADALRSAVSAATTDAPPDGRVVDPPQWLASATDADLLRRVTEVWQYRQGLVLRYTDRDPVALRLERGRYRVDLVGSIATVEAEGVRVWG